MECEEKCRLASKISSRRLAEEAGEPDLDSSNYEVGVCKSRWAHEQVSESPSRLALATLSAVWTPIVTGGPVKLGEVSDHSACRRVGRQSRLMSLKG